MDAVDDRADTTQRRIQPVVVEGTDTGRPRKERRSRGTPRVQRFGLPVDQSAGAGDRYPHIATSGGAHGAPNACIAQRCGRSASRVGPSRTACVGR